MGHAIEIAVGVIIAQEAVESAWEEHRWRAVAVLLDAPAVDDWREYGREGETVFYHAATLPLELHRKETPAYLLNLSSGEPEVWIVLRQDPASAGTRPVVVHAVSASPHDVQVYGESEVETINSVPMPAPLVALVEHFIAQHHVEEPFVKRQRQRHHQPEQEKFGQQPIFQRGSGRGDHKREGGDHD